MQIAGIIAEYNPFHTGHAYHIQRTRELTGADYIVAVMSGDFVQRGGPAFLPSYLRTKMALMGGADIVIELPSTNACESAEFFAHSAVSLLDGLGCIDYLSFGSESGDITLIRSLGDFLSHEPQSYKNALQEQLKHGLSFPAAREQALLSTWREDTEVRDFLSSPNNILGIEYCKALSSIGSSITPVTVLRQGSGYHEQELDSLFPSASGIRKHWMQAEENRTNHLSSSFPAHVWKYLESDHDCKYILEEDDFSLLFRYLLYSANENFFASYQDVSPVLSRKLIRSRDNYQSLSQYIQNLRSKDITYSRISRACFHILLNIDQVPCVSYARLLGFKRSASPVLGKIKKQGRLPLVTKLADAPTYLTDDALSTLKKNISISHIYQSVRSTKYGIPFVNEYTRQLVIL